MEERKNNTGLLVLVILLVMVVLGLVGFIVYDKVINKTNEPNTEENNNENNINTDNTGKTDTTEKLSYEFIDTEEKFDNITNFWNSTSFGMTGFDCRAEQKELKIDSNGTNNVIYFPTKIIGIQVLFEKNSENLYKLKYIYVLTEDNQLYVSIRDEVNNNFAKSFDEFIKITSEYKIIALGSSNNQLFVKTEAGVKKLITNLSNLNKKDVIGKYTYIKKCEAVSGPTNEVEYYNTESYLTLNENGTFEILDATYCQTSTNYKGKYNISGGKITLTTFEDIGSDSGYHEELKIFNIKEVNEKTEINIIYDNNSLKFNDIILTK